MMVIRSTLPSLNIHDNVHANDSLTKLKDIKLKNINPIIRAQLNINTLRNKFFLLEGNSDWLC